MKVVNISDHVGTTNMLTPAGIRNISVKNLIGKMNNKPERKSIFGLPKVLYSFLNFPIVPIPYK